MGFWADIKRAYREGAAKQTAEPAEPPAVRRVDERPGGKRPRLRAFTADDDRLAAVGESNYQPALRAACDDCQDIPLRVECRAAFIAEPDNQFDPYAIRVEVRGRKE